MKKCWIFLIVLVFFSSRVVDAASFKTEKWQTQNGLRVVFYQAMEVPMLDIGIAFAAGSAYDGQSFGLAALTGLLLQEGSGSWNASQVAENLANVGAQWNIDTNKDMTVLQLRTLTSSEPLKKAVDMFKWMLTKPAFKPQAVNRQKKQQLLAIMQAQESPDDMANSLFFNKLYKEHPYAHATNGTLESVKKLSVSQVRTFYKRHYVTNNAVMVLVGAIDSAKAHALAEELSHDLPKGEMAAPIPKASPLMAAEQVAIDFPSSQTVLRLGQVGVTHADPAYFPLLVGNYILGGGSLVSRLALTVREKQGLTYSIVSQLMPMPGEGPFLISFATKNSEAARALQSTQTVLADFLEKGPTEQELIAAKQYLTGSFPLALASNSSIATMLLKMAFYRLPENYLDTYVDNINAVTTAAIKESFDKLVHPQRMLLVSVGKK